MLNKLKVKPPRALLLAASHLGAYGLWTIAFRLLVLTLITYFLMSSNSRFQEISDAYVSNELMLVGIGALLYTALLRWLNPLTSTTTQEIINWTRVEKRVVPGLLQGSILALAILIAFLLSGLYQYLGIQVQFEDIPIWLTNVLLRIAAIACLVYCEEFLFRYKLLNYVRRLLPDLYAIVLVSLAYCGIKWIQFDLGLMHTITLFLVSMTLGIRTIRDGDFARGAGYWMGLLVVFHPLLSLPILGNDFQGVLLVKYQLVAEREVETFRLLTGGMGGPLSSFALQLLFAVDMIQGILKNKQILMNTKVQRIPL